MATAMPAISSYHATPLWMLANVAVYEAHEIASTLPVQHREPLADVLSGFTTFGLILHVRGGFKRLSVRQRKLLDNFREAHPEQWSHQECAEMMQLLDELLVDERKLIADAMASPRRVSFWWGESPRVLLAQTAELEQICQRLDALSVPEIDMPGDQDYGDFMSLLSEPVEHDFSVDTPRKAYSLAR